MISKKVTALLSAAAMLASMMTPFTVAHAAETTLYVNAAYEDAQVDATHFKSIRDAVAAAKVINPQSASDEVTINVYPGNYEEQVRIDGMKYLTLQQTPGTSEDGRVNLNWYFCTGYYTSNTDLNGLYDPKIDWSLDETWNGYNEGDEKFTEYEIGQSLEGVSAISYYDTGGIAHKNVAKNSMLDRLGGLAWSYDKMAPLIVTRTSSDITIKDFNLVNSTVTMKTQGQDDGHLTPDPSRNLPDHNALAICDETTTPVKPTADIYGSDGGVDYAKYKAYVDSQTADFKFTAAESAWLAQSSIFNERGHAIAILGDRIICENLRVRGNQDSVWVSDGRTYFKNCDLIGGTDYIYGSAAVVFDGCKLGFAGFTDKTYGSPLATPNTPASRKYGYLFFDCTIYNVRDNNGANNYGGAWGNDGQSTFYNTTLDDKAEIGSSPLKIEDKGWARFGAENGLSRLYEYGTKNNSGAAVDLSKRIVNLSEEEGGPGMGTVLDKWQILEFNPRNVFSIKNDSTWTADWDPMNFSAKLADTDAEIEAATITVPAGEETEVSLPTPENNNVEFHWESNSTNAVVSGDGTKLTVVRPALGESAINSSVILYARDKTTGYGDKKEIPVTIAATTDTTNVFNIPITLNQTLAEKNNYTVTVSKEGALIKQQVIKVTDKETTATIENIPASAEGIDYDIKIVSESDQYSITTPGDGEKTVKGITGTDVPLTVSASKLVDAAASLATIDYANTSGTQYYDLIALAKAVDENADGNIENSDIITIEYDFVPASANAKGYIDLRSNTVSANNTNADNKRYVLERVNDSWHQLDTVDCTQGFGGTQNVDGHQWLNIAGKYENGDDITTPAHITTTINYKTQTITQSATGSGTSKNTKTDPFTFTGFPEAEKGSMYLYMYSGGGTWGVKNVSVTYKRLATEDDKAEEKPEASSVPEETNAPTEAPTNAPTEAPTNAPTEAPTNAPTEAPTNAPTEAPANEPTEAPTNAPTEAPTNAPDTSKRIVMAYKDNGNTVVELANISDGVVIGAVYEGTALKQIKSAAVEGSKVTIEGIEADKVMVWNNLKDMEPVCAAADVLNSKPESTAQPTTEPDGFKGVTVDFTTLSAVPVYSGETGQGFVAKSDAIMPAGSEREVAPVSAIVMSETDGAKVTESTGAYLTAKKSSDDGDSYNYGGLIYRVDTGAPGLYHLEVTVDGTSSDTRVAPTGMNSGNLTISKVTYWDNANEVLRNSYATWDGSKWSYDFGTGEDFVEIEIEPTSLATSSATKTVGVKSIKITPIDVKPAGDKPTIHIIGDSTQKTYTFNETISAWGQTLGNYFDASKVNVINYSMGGRAMKSNYNEGRFNEILAAGKSGDYVFLHSAHNDETISTNRFSRGAGSVANDLAANNENYNKWLDMYVEAIKARGMTPVLVTAMPRVNGSTGKYSESETKPNGFNPDSPANMRAKAAADENVGLAELYVGAKEYYAKLDGKEVAYIYNQTEAGETPANNAANGAKGDGTHYKEAASKQFSRIILQSIYDQSVATTDTYTDKAIMQKLVTLMRSDVQTAAASANHDWSAVFPEMASDVSAVDVVPGAAKQSEANYYYRNNIEKALQLGLLNKDTDNLFKPTQTITVGEYARGIEKAFGLAANSLTSYTKTYAQLQADENVSPFAPSSVSETDAIYQLSDEGGSGSAEQFTVTVTQPTGGTVTVYNESAFSTVTADVPSGVTANQQLADNDNFTFAASEIGGTLSGGGTIGSGSDNGGVFADNADISKNYIDVRVSGNDKYPAKYTAKKDGYLTVYYRAGSNKKICIAPASGGTAVEQTPSGTVSGSNTYGAAQFSVTAGTEYNIYVSGGTGRLFGVKYESTNYPQSTTSLTVDKGDQIRAVVVPDANYVVDGITVDGTKHSGREYTFTVNANTTVSAVLDSEPALVTTTMVATDAPLTREIMGAILYDAYQAVEDKTTIQKYMAQNGGVPSPSDPNYDPNIQYEGSPYTPLTGWGALTDKESLNNALYAKVKAAYNLGLIRSETGIARGSIALGTELQPTAEVTRAKAAKSLVFAFILTQPQNDASQKIPAGFAAQSPAAIAAPNSAAQTTVFTTAE